MKSLECNDSNFKSDPLFNREPMKLNKQRSDMFTSTAMVNEPCSTIIDTLQTLKNTFWLTIEQRITIVNLDVMKA